MFSFILEPMLNTHSDTNINHSSLQAMDHEAVKIYIQSGVEFYSITSMPPNSLMYIPPGWHCWTQNGGSGSGGANRDLCAFELHGIPKDCERATQNFAAQVELMETIATSEVAKLEITMAKAVLEHLRPLAAKGAANIDDDTHGLAPNLAAPVSPGPMPEHGAVALADASPGNGPEDLE